MATKTIKKDDKLPSEVELCYFDGNDMKKKTVGELTKNKKVVLVGVPGAFTPTCSLQHVPGFIAKAEELKSRGVDLIGCVSVNDAFVMRAWGKDLAATDKVAMLADGSGDFTRAAGLELDLSDKGLGVRCRRFALLAEDGVVKVLHLEKGGDFDVSSAEDLLKAL